MSRYPINVAQTCEGQQPDPALLEHVDHALHQGAVPLPLLRTRMPPASAR